MAERANADADALNALRLIGPDPQNWVPPKPGIDHDVTIVGGGQTGSTFAFALRRAGIANVTVIDVRAGLLSSTLKALNEIKSALTGSADPRAPELIASDLANNIAHGVRWHDATTVARELGCNLFLEMPPGHVLTDLAKENLPGVNALPVERDILPRVLRLAQQEITKAVEAE